MRDIDEELRRRRLYPNPAARLPYPPHAERLATLTKNAKKKRDNPLDLCADCGKRPGACTCASFVRRILGDAICQSFTGEGGPFCGHLSRRHDAGGRCLAAGCGCTALELP